MVELNEKLASVRNSIENGKIKIMIIGLGSVGLYLLDYLLNKSDPTIELVVVGRNHERMISDVNIVRIASTIRNINRNRIEIVGDCDLDDINSIERVLTEKKPDIIVNASRVYSGLKYGSISWKSLRAYGIWSPLAIKYIKNIMKAYRNAGLKSIVINTSYSDVVIPWLKSAGEAFPDFGSGNINHLVPRIKYAVAEKLKIVDFWNIDVTLATSHFHDVVVSKEGHSEGMTLLLAVKYNGKKVDISQKEIFEKCKIAMPVDAKRNMMNASSNYEIIDTIITTIRTGTKRKIHIPGVLGEIGGYPFIIDATQNFPSSYFDESEFSLSDMRKKNKESIYFDGIEDVSDSQLVYTDELICKVKNAFGVTIPKRVSFEQIDEIANLLISGIVQKNI